MNPVLARTRTFPIPYCPHPLILYPTPCTHCLSHIVHSSNTIPSFLIPHLALTPHPSTHPLSQAIPSFLTPHHPLILYSTPSIHSLSHTLHSFFIPHHPLIRLFDTIPSFLIPHHPLLPDPTPCCVFWGEKPRFRCFCRTCEGREGLRAGSRCGCARYLLLLSLRGAGEGFSFSCLLSHPRTSLEISWTPTVV